MNPEEKKNACKGDNRFCHSSPSSNTYRSPFNNPPDHSSSNHEVGNIKYVNVINRDFQIYHVERIQRSFSTTIHTIGVLSARLVHRAVFIGRQFHFLRKKNYYPLAKQFPNLAQKILDFMTTRLSPELHDELYRKFCDPSLPISDDLYKKLSLFEFYENLYHFLKDEQVYIDLKNIYSPLPQQVLRYVGNMWKSYYNLLIKYLENPELFPADFRVNIPGYRRKRTEFKFGIPGMYLNNVIYAKRIVENFYDTQRSNIIYNRFGKIIRAYNTAELSLPPKFMRSFELLGEDFPTIRTTIDIEQIQEIKFIPKEFFYVVEIVYTKNLEIDPYLDYTRALSIDIGVKILTALTMNFRTSPILIQGNKIRSINQWMNKKIAQLRSIQTMEITPKNGRYLPETIEMKRIRRKRNNIINDYFHKVSRYIINLCQWFHIGKIAIGYNIGWKQKINLGKRNNQNFAYIPYFKLIQKIQYKAKLVGIEVKIVKEDHTSKCSALDFESIKHHDVYLGRRGILIKGKNKKKQIIRGNSEYKWYKARGLFRSSNGTIIHSDVNASFNIGRVAFPDLFNKNTLARETMLLNPLSIEV